METDGMRVPPHSEEAEIGVLGSVLLDPLPSIGTAQAKRLTAEMFYDQRHQALYRCLLEMVSENFGMDALTIGEWLKDHNELERVGGYDHLVKLQDATLVPAHVEYYAQIVIEKHRYRAVIALASGVVGDAYKAEIPAFDILQGMSGDLVRLMDRRTVETNADVLERWYARMVAIKNGDRTNGLPLPWPKLDAMMCGLEPGLILVGARPSAGKTTLEVNIVDYLAREGCPVGRACLDMSKEALLSRSVIRESRVSLPLLKYGYARWNQLETVRECKDLVASWPIHVIEDNTLEGICSTARMLKLKHGIELLTVDFAQLITTGNGHMDSNMNALMGMVTKQLKALAFELDIPVVLLSQLSRGSDKDDRRPRLSDLRDSGNLEQNATQVILMSKAKPEDYFDYDKTLNPEPLPEDADRRILRGVILDLAKNQNGEIGALEVWLRPNYFRFEEAEPEFNGLKEKLVAYEKDAKADAASDLNEPVVCDGDDEVEDD